MLQNLLFGFVLFLLPNVKLEVIEDECIPIKNCNAAIKLLKGKDSHPKNVQLLQSSKCGEAENQEPMVRCKQLNQITSFSCTPIKECTTAIKLLKFAGTNENIRRMLQFSQCGYIDYQPKVNCSFIDKEVLKLGKYYDDEDCVHITKCPEAYKHPNILKNAYCGIGEIKVKCSMFPNKTGDQNCISIRQCPQALEYPDLLNKSFCGHGEIKVICNRFPKAILRHKVTQCGIQDTTFRIFGGNFTSLDEFPWLALIYGNYGHYIDHICHGTLINHRFVLTAAHCVHPDLLRAHKIYNLDSVVLGEYDTGKEKDCLIVAGTEDCADPIQKYGIANILIHPEFSKMNGSNDIALIKLDRKVVYTDFIKPICLPRKNLKIKQEQKFWVSGWGKTETVLRSSVKLKAIVDYVEHDECRNKLRRNLDKNIICAGNGNGVDTCKGDSGGPLMLEQKTRHNMITYQVGIVSFGSKCGYKPATYTFIPNYINWISNNIKN